MDPEKAEFKRLIDLMGWSQSEAARRLYKTPAAVNHLVNPDHPNKPTETTLQLLKLIIASERPELFEAAFKLKEGPRLNDDQSKLNAKERGLIELFRQALPEEQEKIYAVIKAIVR
jgi:transcriptional regulator with XRE-family HTH domain